jgi:molecular chaperone HtpG
MKEKETEKYLKFYKEFGNVLKEGINYDYENKETLRIFYCMKLIKHRRGVSFLQEYVEQCPRAKRYLLYFSEKPGGCPGFASFGNISKQKI